MIDFPANPVNGQVFTSGSQSWTYDGAKWLPSGNAALAAPAMNDNRIINGDMRIDQRNNGASGTANGYTVDRWQYGGTQAGKLSWQRVPSSGNTDFPYALRAVVSTAYTPTVSDTFYFVQPVEADMIGDFAWGTASAKSVTLSFWAYSSLIGTFSGSLSNSTPNRSYPFTYAISVANTWTKFAITIPGDTAGTWTLTGNGAGLYLNFELGGGATYRAPANAWTTGNFVGANGAASLVANAGAGFLVTGVKLEIGSIATPFNRQSLAKLLADCQRYYQILPAYLLCNYAVGGSGFYDATVFPVAMRNTPTVAYNSPVYSNGSAVAVNVVNQTLLRSQMTVTVTGTGFCVTDVVLSAEL